MIQQSSLLKSVAPSEPPLGTVRVSTLVGATTEATWEKLTNQSAVSLWFGDLSNSLTPGGDARLDFGDSDFFNISAIRLKPTVQIAYNWRFLGTGPLDAITWRIDPRSNGTLVTVTDCNPLRSEKTVAELHEGWIDFLSRLEQHIATGKITRYDWRREFDGSTEVCGPIEHAAKRLLGVKAEQHWIPFVGGYLEAGMRLRLRDEPSTEEVFISYVDRSQPARVAFDLKKLSWSCPTKCQFELEPRRKLVFLTVSHSGWDGISNDPSVGLGERRRFAVKWIEALERAKANVEPKELRVT